MALRGTLYRCHLFSFAGPQSEGVDSRWTYDLVPVGDTELLSGTGVELLVEIGESAGLTLDPDVKIRFDILEEDFLLTGGLDDFVLSLLGSGASAQDNDSPSEKRETFFYELDEGDDAAAWIRRFVDGRPDYRSMLLVLEQPAGDGFRYIILTWWTAERLEDYANSELYFVVNINDEMDDQAQAIDVSPARWDPNEQDPGVWLPMVAGRKLYELLKTSILDWQVTAKEAREALEILLKLRPQHLLQVTGNMRFNKTWSTFEAKILENDAAVVTRFIDLVKTLLPSEGYLVPGDRIGLLIFTQSHAVPEEDGGMNREQYERFLAENPDAAEMVRGRVIDGAQYGGGYADRMFVDPVSFTDQEAQALGEAKLQTLVDQNIPWYDVDHSGFIYVPLLGRIPVADYLPQQAANVISESFVKGEIFVSPSLRLYLLRRGVVYVLHAGTLPTGNHIPMFHSTYVPDANQPAQKRARRLADFHNYLDPLRQSDELHSAAVLWYYNWISVHINEPIFYEKKPEELFTDALRESHKPELIFQNPLEPYIRLSRTLEKEQQSANPTERSRMQRALIVYYEWINANAENQAVLIANDPTQVWIDAYLKETRRDIDKQVQLQREQRLERQRQLEAPLIDKKLDEVLKYVIRNVYTPPEPYTVQGVEEDEGFLGLFAQKRGVGYLVMPSQTEIELERAIGDAYLDDIFSRMFEPGFKDLNVNVDFKRWLADRPHIDDALWTAKAYPYTEKYSFEVDLPAWQTAIEVGVGFVPIVGQIVGVIEVASGTSLFGRQLGPIERGITAAAILLPAAVKLTRAGVGLIHAADIVKTYKLTGREAEAVYRACLPIAEGTAGRRLLQEAADEVKNTGKISMKDPARIRALEDLIRQMKLTDRATARALALPTPPELAGAALATEDETLSLIRSVFREETAAYRALANEPRSAVRAAIRNESALVRRALRAETQEGLERNLGKLLQQMEIYGMAPEQRKLLSETLEGLNRQYRSTLEAAVTAVSRGRIVAVGNATRLTNQATELSARYTSRISKLEAARNAATDAAARRRLTSSLSRLRREQRRLDAFARQGNYQLDEFQRLLSQEPNLRNLVEAGGDQQLLQHWINFKYRYPGRNIADFAGYVEKVQAHGLGYLGEIEVAFRISEDWILIKVPDEMVTVWGTDLIAVSRRDNTLRIIDNKAFNSEQITAVDALGRNIARNIGADVQELGRLARNNDLPAQFASAEKRLSAAHTLIQQRVKGLTKDQIASTAVQQDIAKILADQQIERVVTNAGGKVTEISDELRAMGIDLWDLN